VLAGLSSEPIEIGSMGEAQAADLMSFCASEFHQFFGHLGNSIHTFKTTGKVPPSVFKASSNATAAAKADKPKTKRRPTAFNMFVKQKMEELKQAGVILDGDKNNNGMFTLAVREWKKLSDEGRAEFTAKFKVGTQNAVPPNFGAQCAVLHVANNSSHCIPLEYEHERQLFYVTTNQRNHATYMCHM